MTLAEISLALLLARTCVAEIGFQEDVTECQLMWSINHRNAIKNGWSTRKQTLRFNGYWKSRKQRRKRPWIQYLKGPWKPPAWGKKMLWEVYKERWLAYERAAMAFVKDPSSVDYLCPEAVDYGAPHERPRLFGMETIRCLGGMKRQGGTTRQRYWSLGIKRVGSSNE
jgi:hypothetical protein